MAAPFKMAAVAPVHPQGSSSILWIVLAALAFAGTSFGAAKELGLIRRRL
ncbi:MAG TPA: hypothetical protein VKR21_17710 [Solirubrobacteraceae bacterium]|nr:hypothetical protein [Solirubrobacteraceae bacterium]